MKNNIMNITIKNCNNIKSGTINIERNKLNIKFGINGTGKSTIANAILYKIRKEKDLKTLLPFGLKNANPDNLKPSVEINEEIKSIFIFNEEYVKQFLFQKEELLHNSFEILIQTPKYIKITENIEKQLKEIKNVFSNNKNLEKIILDFESLSKSFKTTQKGLSDASAISKGLENGNKIENIPADLIEYKPFLQNKTNSVNWLDWHIKGNKFSDGYENCPYCVSNNDAIKKEKIKSISENYDKNVIKNFIEMIKAIENLGDYFSDDSKEALAKILKKTNGLSNEEKNYIITIKGQIDNFLDRLKKLRDISFKDFKDKDEDKVKVKEKIEEFIIKIDELFDKLKSDKTTKIVNDFNESLNNTLKKIGELQGEINRQKQEVEKMVKKNEKNINQFLKNAGYKYKVLIEDKNDEYKIRLQHNDFDNNITGGDQHLSFGEKNAFALVLFMHETLSKSHDLIILDDPISSFDKNKKYAILQMLFREDDSFKDKTVLMLTHDIEPIIDSVKALASKFQNHTNASFIKLSKGTLVEKKIEKKNIITFSQICENIIKDSNINLISKLIYLRRNFEILNDKGWEYQILSNLFHKRTKDEAKKESKERNKNLTDKDFEKSFTKGEEKIKKIISKFKYEEILKIVKDENELKKIYNDTKNGYEKLQIFRIINEQFTNDNDFSDVMKKFINETYHIENDFIYQLNPREYDLIPEYIVDECNNVMADRK